MKEISFEALWYESLRHTISDVETSLASGSPVSIYNSLDRPRYNDSELVWMEGLHWKRFEALMKTGQSRCIALKPSDH